jgi:cytoskeletal protein CcmA (bactofilin family)
LENFASDRSVVGEESLLSGHMVGKDLLVLGRFEGRLELKGLLHVGRQGRVNAQVQAGRVEVEGEFEGEICAGALLFGEKARARGVFRADRIEMREGAVLDGAVNLSPAQEGNPDKPQPSSVELASVNREIARWEEEGAPRSVLGSPFTRRRPRRCSSSPRRSGRTHGARCRTRAPS